MLRKTVAVFLSLLLSVMFIVPYSAAETGGTETAETQSINENKADSIVGAPADGQLLGAATFSPRYDAPAANNPYYTSMNIFYKSGYGMPNCTCYAWGRVYEASGAYPNLPTGNANAWFNNASCEKGYSPRPGAVICGNAGQWGHVAFVEKVYDDGVHFDLTESSYRGAYFNVRYNITSGNFSGFQGFLYPFNGGTPTPQPSNPWMSCNKTVAAAGDSVTFTFGANDATNYTIGIDRNGTRIITEGVSSGKSYTFSDEGNYSAYVTAANSAGWVDSPRVDFTVFKPCLAGDDFYAYIYHATGNLAVGADSSDNVLLQERSNADNQKWHFQRNTDNSYRITNIGRQKCLDLAGGTANSNENIQTWEANDSQAQKWYLRYLATGYSLVPECNTSSAMDIVDGVLRAGTNIRDWRANTSGAQTFNLEYIGLKPSAMQTFNGHRYEYYDISTTWVQANKLCETLGGHLVTVSSQEENSFIVSLSGGKKFVWLGGYASGSDRKWEWVTDEAFSYTNWGSGEPNNSGGNESYLHMVESGQWNDIMVTANANSISFVCEYEDVTINADDYQPSGTTLYNNSKYEFYDTPVTWTTAKLICEKKGGHLVIINDAAENSFIKELTKTDVWLGITDSQKEGEWKTVTGEKAPYVNWDTGQPDNCFTSEHYGELWGAGKWNDYYNHAKVRFVCEYDDAVHNLKPAAEASRNGHRYALYNIDTTWSQAYKLCDELGGHLVTLSSKEENDFVLNLAKDNAVNKAIWIGGSDNGSEGAWYWITGEAFSYTNWAEIEPNNDQGNEHFAQMMANGLWNDIKLDGNGNTTAFVCEFEDTVIDASGYTPVRTALNDNSFYEFYTDKVTWTQAKAICEKKGGHLIVINNKAENDLAVSLLTDDYESWIGITDKGSEGNWTDVTGKKVTYFNWNDAQPDNYMGIEHYGHLYKSGFWNDYTDFASMHYKMGFICEYDNVMKSVKPVVTTRSNGHKYELYNTPMSWKDAYKFCEKKGGHLVTVNSQNEQAVLEQLIKDKATHPRLWLGATDEYSEGKWKWITGESIDYQNWSANEPNDTDDEDFMMLYINSGTWNDVYDSTKGNNYDYSFICEYDNLSDASSYKSVKQFEYNDNRYEVYSNVVDWQTAKRICELKGGHLLVVNSKAENDAVFNEIQGLQNDHYWIGLTDYLSEGDWQWLTPTTSIYTNWSASEPNNDGGLENYGEIIASSGKWNDMAGYYCIHRSVGFICEYEAHSAEPSSIPGDVNGDGNVDVTDATLVQMFAAEFIELNDQQQKAADTNRDGKVDVTDATLIQMYAAELIDRF